MTKKYRIEITRSAEEDLRKIFKYIAEDSKPNAVKFIDQVQSKIHALQNFPERFEIIKETVIFGVQYRHILLKDYRIIYRVTNECVYIMRIIHGSKLLDL